MARQHKHSSSCPISERGCSTLSFEPTEKQQFGSGRFPVRKAELPLSELLAEVKTLSHTPEAAFQKFRQIEYIKRAHMDEISAHEAAQIIHNTLEAAMGNNSDDWAYDISYFLTRVARAGQAHAHLRAMLQQDPYREQIVNSVRSVVTHEGESVYREPRAVSQIASSQHLLNIYVEEFWRNMSALAHCPDTWDRMATIDIVHACGALHASGAAPAPSDDLIQLQRAAVIQSAPQFRAQDVARAVQSFAQQGVQLGEAQVAMQEAVARTAHDMRGYNLLNCLHGYAVLREELGAAREPLMQRLAVMSPHLKHESVSRCLWACGELKVPAGEWTTGLLRAVRRSLMSQRGSRRGQACSSCGSKADGPEMSKALESVGG